MRNDPTWTKEHACLQQLFVVGFPPIGQDFQLSREAPRPNCLGGPGDVGATTCNVSTSRGAAVVQETQPRQSREGREHLLVFEFFLVFYSGMEGFFSCVVVLLCSASCGSADPVSNPPRVSAATNDAVSRPVSFEREPAHVVGIHLTDETGGLRTATRPQNVSRPNLSGLGPRPYDRAECTCCVSPARQACNGQLPGKLCLSRPPVVPLLQATQKIKPPQDVDTMHLSRLCQGLHPYVRDPKRGYSTSRVRLQKWKRTRCYLIFS